MNWWTTARSRTAYSQLCRGGGVSENQKVPHERIQTIPLCDSLSPKSPDSACGFLMAWGSGLLWFYIQITNPQWTIFFPQNLILFLKGACLSPILIVIREERKKWQLSACVGGIPEKSVHLRGPFLATSAWLCNSWDSLESQQLMVPSYHRLAPLSGGIAVWVTMLSYVPSLNCVLNLYSLAF